jgi:hypothetical protein
MITDPTELLRQLRSFRLNDAPGPAAAAEEQVVPTPPPGSQLPLWEAGVPRISNEFWTARQRQGHSLHEISYRACFKAQLPAFFIERLCPPGGRVLDPFMGRGTTPLEAALRGHIPCGCDINPLGPILLEPRLAPPTLEAVERRLAEIPWAEAEDPGLDLSMFYHPDTLRSLTALRRYLRRRRRDGSDDALDRWIRMVAINRLSGHSRGFFSVYTMPPNQAVSAAKQVELNQRRAQQPEPREVAALILRKSRSLLRGLSTEDRRVLASVAERRWVTTAAAEELPGLRDRSIDLTVTSPPFVDVVDYALDNWLRCWFAEIPSDEVAPRIARHSKVEAWQRWLGAVMAALFRVTRRGGWVAFEVGEVHGGRTALDEVVAPTGIAAGFECVGIAVNQQRFTKTANCWGVANNRRGTNSNRIVLFHKR